MTSFQFDHFTQVDGMQADDISYLFKFIHFINPPGHEIIYMAFQSMFELRHDLSFSGNINIRYLNRYFELRYCKST